ncbi:hypothetical protein LCGC14_2151710 [marine sediment metagenome]|uniref:BON domain-containing protein n=1 Tax=marine sediment metagenome TaxID=412755 RepID=A0A0F9G8F9_9ZZZZ|nr:mechanosensitive ion channel [Methylophaga sp.]
MIKKKLRKPSIFSILILIGLAQTISPVYADEISDLLGTQADNADVSSSTNVISTDNTDDSDKKISNRLDEIFTEIDDLNTVKADVNKGVVQISGEVSSIITQQKAESLANKVAGVVEVENDIVVNRSLEKRLETTWNKLLNLGKQIVSDLPLFVTALVIFILFWWIGSWVSKQERFFRKVSANTFIADLLGQITHIIFIFMGLVVALSLLDATALLGTIMGAAGIFGLAIGFAVRDTVENYIASILLSIRNPFQMNDFVNIDGNEGNVARLTSRATILITPDGNHLRIPNAQVYKAIITNFTRNSERRFSFDLGVDSAQNLDEAQHLALETLKNMDGILDSPKPLALVENLGDFNVIIRVFAWVDQQYHDFGKVRSETIKKVKVAFDEANIIMPEPIYQVRVSDASNLQALESINPGTEDIRQEIPQKLKPTNISAEVSDIKPDKTAKEHVDGERADGSTENLLNSTAPSE